MRANLKLHTPLSLFNYFFFVTIQYPGSISTWTTHILVCLLNSVPEFYCLIPVLFVRLVPCFYQTAVIKVVFTVSPLEVCWEESSHGCIWLLSLFFFGGHQEAWQIVGHGCFGKTENLQKLRAEASHPYFYHRREHCAPNFTQIVMTGVQEDMCLTWTNQSRMNSLHSSVWHRKLMLLDFDTTNLWLVVHHNHRPSCSEYHRSRGMFTC